MTDHVRQIKLPEVRVPGRRLGRHIVHDQRSHDFEAERATTIVSVTHKALGLPLDQGNIGSCTANAECGANNADPNSAKLKNGPFTEKGAVTLYELETKNEGQPYPPNDPGGSGLEVCKAAVQLGWISGYTHAFGIQHALAALVKLPAITGVSWYDSFDTPDKDGLVSIAKGAQVRGGHEFVALRIIAEHELVGFANSWGTAYGVPDPEMGLPDGGAFYMSFETWDALLQQQGDVTVPIA